MMRPTALVLNLLVASIATTRFARAGFFSWSLFWPFALGSIPFAYVGGAITLPGHWYRTLVGLVLWTAAVRLWLDLKLSAPHLPPRTCRRVVRCGYWAPGGADWNGRWHLSESAPALHGLGGDARDGRRLGSVHPRQFGGRIGRKSREHWQSTGAAPHMGDRRCCRWNYWFRTRESKTGDAHVQAVARRRPGDCGGEADLLVATRCHASA